MASSRLVIDLSLNSGTGLLFGLVSEHVPHIFDELALDELGRGSLAKWAMSSRCARQSERRGPRLRRAIQVEAAGHRFALRVKREGRRDVLPSRSQIGQKGRADHEAATSAPWVRGRKGAMTRGRPCWRGAPHAMSPISTPLCRLHFSLCRVAIDTVTPPTRTGSRTAKGSRLRCALRSPRCLEASGLLFGGELVGDGPAGKFRGTAQLALVGVGIDLDDGAVDLVL